VKVLFALLVMCMAALPAAAGEKPSYAAPVCGAGLPGDHPAGMDRDHDGIPDSEDWCPTSKEDSRVGYKGCAESEVPVRCEEAGAVPAAPTTRVVPPVKGKDTDSDDDGVEDEDDKCPGTPRGLEVDRKGCVKIEKVVLKGVNFATGSAKLLPAASDTLRTVATAMKAAPKVEVEVGGHTDSVGNEKKNQGLSERRAQSVKAFLVGEGVEADRLSTQGYGESDPVDSNDTAEGRANNRRVAFKVTRD